MIIENTIAVELADTGFDSTAGCAGGKGELLATATGSVASRKPKRLRKILIALLVLGALAAALLYRSPTTLGMVSQSYSAWTMGLENHDVTLGGYRIHYMAGGQGKPLVLVHGLAGRAENWLPLIPEFIHSGYRVYALDLLGYGRSDRPDVDYSIALETDILRQFLDSQNLPQTDLTGWSMGGWISLKFAAENASRVHRLVLMDSAGLLFDSANADALRPKTEDQLAHMMQVLTPHPQPIPGFVARDILRGFAENDWVVGRSLDSMRTGRDLMDGKMQTVTMPVLVIWGKQDVLTPLSVAEGLHRGMPQSLLYVLDGTGHLAPTERSAQIAKEVTSFLKSEPPLSAGVEEIPEPHKGKD
jgi:pimeloyl-ACP methyl ester carboxylesterase